PSQGRPLACADVESLLPFLAEHLRRHTWRGGLPSLGCITARNFRRDRCVVDERNERYASNYITDQSRNEEDKEVVAEADSAAEDGIEALHRSGNYMGQIAGGNHIGDQQDGQKPR